MDAYEEITNWINKLIESDISSYRIQEDTGISGNTIRCLRLPEEHPRKRNIDNLNGFTLHTLYKYAKKNIN